MAANRNNYGAFTTGLRRLVVAVKENAALLPDVAPSSERPSDA